MLKVQAPAHSLLFISVLYREDLFTHSFFEELISDLYGELIAYKPEHNPLLEYYSKEMGTNLSRIFFVSAESYPREILLSSKLTSLEWERKYAQDDKRMVNIDTGLISLENFLLATTKNYSHRIYLGQNIFADLTYQCVNGQYETLPWTYPDFVDPKKLEFLNWCRNYLLTQSKVKSL